MNPSKSQIVFLFDVCWVLVLGVVRKLEESMRS